MNRDLANARIALEAVLGNKVRSGLTALGIIFGVASVIAMMAVILLVDTNANTRMQDYKDRLVQAEQQ